MASEINTKLYKLEKLLVFIIMAKKKRKKRGKSKETFSKKLKIAKRGLLWFLVLAIASYVLWIASSATFFVNLFGVLFIIFVFLAAAFLISLIVLWLVKKK